MLESPQSQKRGAVKHVVSLGSQCVMADLFKRAKLREYAAPFDWLGSCPAMVEHCIWDNFADFMNADNYMHLGSKFDAVGLPEGSTARERKLIGHKVFSKMLGGRGVVFPHRDPLHSKEDYTYTQRTALRFQRVLASPEHKLFTVMKVSDQPWGEAGVQEWFKVFKALQARTTNFELVAVKCVQNCGHSIDGKPVLYREYSGNGSRMLMYVVQCAG